MQPSRSSRLLLAALGAVLWLCLTPWAGAQTAAQTDIANLLSQGQARQALVLAQQSLANNPRDPQIQFLKANAELALGQNDAAAASFEQITQAHPELPEPWNNLAVIRAGQGRLPEARQHLEQALRNNPDYAQAHANLADVLVQLAVEHLQTAQALQPDASTAARLQTLEPLRSR